LNIFPAVFICSRRAVPHYFDGEITVITTTTAKRQVHVQGTREDGRGKNRRRRGRGVEAVGEDAVVHVQGSRKIRR